MIDLEEVLSFDDVGALCDRDALDAIAQLVDHASDHGDLGLNAKALAWCDDVAQRPLSPKNSAVLDYFRAHIWGHRQQVRQSDRAAVWAWDQEDIQR